MTRRIGEKLGQLSPTRAAAVLAMTYAVASWAWIAVSDLILISIPLPERWQHAIEVGKGLFFVSATAVWLFALANMYLKRLDRTAEELRSQNQRVRQVYEELLDTITGGKLLLVTSAELEGALGAEVVAETQIGSPSELKDARAAILQACGKRCTKQGEQALLSTTGEALNNALKHAGAGSYAVHETNDGLLQVLIRDHGPGIDFRNLPRSALLPGFSTAGTLGMGFTIMLSMAKRLMLATEPGFTALLIEIDPTAEQPLIPPEFAMQIAAQPVMKRPAV